MCYLCNVNKTRELFNVMTHNELIRRLERAGCTLLRHGTRHDIWYSPITGKKATVPRHGRKEVPPGTLKSIEKELLGL